MKNIPFMGNKTTEITEKTLPCRLYFSKSLKQTRHGTMRHKYKATRKPVVSMWTQRSPMLEFDWGMATITLPYL